MDINPIRPGGLKDLLSPGRGKIAPPYEIVLPDRILTNGKKHQNGIPLNGQNRFLHFYFSYYDVIMGLIRV